MTRDEIVKLAREADLWLTSDERIAAVERFAALVAAREREECAKVCEELFQRTPPYTTYAEAAQDCADAIRNHLARQGGSEMKETKHTPGPWTVGETRRYKHSGGIDGTEVAVHYGPAGNRGNCIAFAYGHGASGDAEADARLIAAAPDLLEALCLLLDRIESPDGKPIKQARAAIAKATVDAV